MNKLCPLCHSDNIYTVESFSADRLNRAWYRSFGIDASIQSNTVAYMSCKQCHLGFFDPPEAGDENLYVQLQQHDWYYTSDKPEYELAMRMLPESGPVLEVGSGKAAFAAYVGAERYTGLEFNDAAILRAGEMGITLMKETIEDHAAKHSGAYAAVVSFQVLEHVRDIHGFLKGCVNALAPGGKLIIGVPDHEGICGAAQNNILDMPPHHLSHWSAPTLRFVATIFNLDEPEMITESISEQHAEWAVLAQEEGRLRRLFGLRQTLFDDSIASRLIGKVAKFRAKGKAVPENMGGHTILASFKKPSK